MTVLRKIMPRWLYVTLCLVLFAAVMLALRAALHATVPSGLDSARSWIGADAVTSVLVGLFLVAAYFGWGPLLRARLAKRRGASIRKDQ